MNINNIHKRYPKHFIATSLFLLFCFSCCTVVKAQINVNPAQTAAALAAKLAGKGVTVINPVLTCHVNANGFF